MAIWYRASKACNAIKEVEVEKETDKFIMINGQLNSKDSVGIWYRPTREEVKQCLINARQEDVTYHSDCLNYVKRQLEEAKKA